MNRRLVALIFLFSFLFVGLTGKTFYEQIINGPEYLKKSLSNRTINFAGEEFIRGDILDRNGISLSDAAVRPTIVIYPKLVQDPLEVVNKIEGLELRHLEPYSRQGVKIYPQPFLIHIDPQNTHLLKNVQDIESPGVTIVPIKTRYGPNSLAQHIVGYIGYQGDSKEQKGIKGIERIFDQELRGKSPERIITPILDARNNILTGLGYRNISFTLDTARTDIYLTIDSRFQKIAENALDGQGVLQGAAVLIDIATGQILAAVSRPAYDQNNPSWHLPGYNNQLERVIDYRVYPGSIFKIITAAAALEEGIVKPDSIFSCQGSASVSHVTCPSAHGELTFTEAMARSCNITFVQLGLELGQVKLEEYMIDKFGFTPVQGRALNSNRARANGIIGQEVFLTSPLELANMIATIARGGLHQKIINPWQSRLVLSIGRPLADLDNLFEPIMNVQTAKQLQQMLAFTNQKGSGHRAWLGDWGSAGKTGTSQSAKSNEFCAWYVGYAPLEHPQYALAVLVEEKTYLNKSLLQGGLHAAPVFKDIMQGVLDLQK